MTVMNRLPWAPLNAGAFLIILGGLTLLAIFNVVSFSAAIPLVFAFFGIWLIAEAFIIPPSNAYAPSKGMVMGWGALIAGLGLFWFVGATSAPLLPVLFAIILVVVGIAAVGYSFTRASPSTSKTPSS